MPATELAPSVIAPQLERGTAHVFRLKAASRLSGRAVANGYSREKPESPHVWHVYPEGSLGFLCERLAADLGGLVRLESPVEAILVENGRAVGVRVSGQVHEASAVVSTAPVHILAKLVQGTDALRHLAEFRYRPMVLVNMRFDGPWAAARRRHLDAGRASCRSSVSPRPPGRCRGSPRRERPRSTPTSAATWATRSGRCRTRQLGELCLEPPRGRSFPPPTRGISAVGSCARRSRIRSS